MARSHGRLVALTLLVLVPASVFPEESLAQLAERERKRREARAGEPVPLFTDQNVNGRWVGWRDFQPPDGSFVVQMPERPSVERGEVCLGSRFVPAPRKTFRATDADGSEYILTYTDYPSAYLEANRDRPYLLFQSEGESSKKWYDSYAQTSTNLSQHQALLLRGTYAQTAGALIGNRFYELSVVRGGKASMFGAGVHPFFRSFAAQ